MLSLVRPPLGLHPVITRSTLDTIQFLHRRPLSAINCQQPLHFTRAYVPKTQSWVLNQLGIVRTGRRILPGLLTATGIAGIALATYTVPTIHCDGEGSASAPPTPPESAVNVHEMKFDKLIGICVGVLIKQVATMLKFFLGPFFILFQLLNPMSLFHIDWDRGTVQFVNPWQTEDASLTISSMQKSVVDFFMAEFQPQSFNEGVAVGLRA